MTESNRPSGKSIDVFLSYSHQDEGIASELKKHLSVLARAGEIKTWYDRHIDPGKEWQSEIDERLNSAKIILILVSPDFLASDYCYDVEMRRALARHDAGDAVVIPIIVRPSDWSHAPFAKLQALPRDARPVSSWADEDAAFLDIATNLRSLIWTFDLPETKPIEANVQLEIVVNRDFDSFTKEDENKVVNAIQQLLKGASVKVVRKERGSVRLRLRLTADEVVQLQEAIQSGDLRSLDVVDAEVLVTDGALETRSRPSVFIGSSKEGLSVAEAVQVNLDEICEVTIWSQGVFGVGQSTLETLVNQLDEFDFAILILTPDDLIESRGLLKDSPRDNVLLELGLFIGRLGRERTFTVFDRTADLKLPSDLAGVTPATYQPHSSGNFEAALGAPCTRLKKTILQLGLRNRRA